MQPQERPEFEQRVLFRICENGNSLSSLTLAIEEGGRGNNIQADMVQWAIDALCADGLVTYRLGSYGMYVHIRPTSKGYDAAGYPPPKRGPGRIVRELEHTPLRAGDTTDYRSFDDRAVGGEIEKMPLEEHLVWYPEHIPIHPSPWELEMSRRGMVTQANGLDVGPPIDQDAVAGLVIEQLGKKMLVLEALHQNGRAQTVQDLVRWTKGLDHGLDAREITKTLWNLYKLGYVKFTERHQELVKIDLTPRAVAEFFPKPKVAAAPVERINVPAKPKVIAATRYELPEPPRYSAPPPPPQNTKSFTDDQFSGSRSMEGDSRSMEAQGKEHVVDTHTQYVDRRSRDYVNESYDLYPDAKGAGGRVSRLRALEFTKSVINVGSATAADIARAMGLKTTGGQVTVLSKVAQHFGYIRVDENRHLVATVLGVADAEEFGEFLRADKIARPRGEFEVQGQKFEIQAVADAELDRVEGAHTVKPSQVKPMEVVSRDEHDAEKKPLSVDRPYVEATKVYLPGLEPVVGPNLADFPLIKDLMSKESRLARYERAAEILAEDPDDKDTAEMVLGLLERIQITDLEKEVIRYVRAVTS